MCIPWKERMKSKMSISITLRPFQKGAVQQLLYNLRDMKQTWEDYGSLSWTCLKAPTGAGKTVMAGAVIDSLLYPKKTSLIPDRFSDRDAVILWVCEKSLLLQSQSKLKHLLESDALGEESIRTISADSLSQGLEKGKIYFLETQLLGEGKHISSPTDKNGGLTFWKVLQDAIDQKIPVYCFMDEAHRGFNSAATKDSIRERIIQNIPFVIGISATEDNFVSYMKNTKRLDYGVVSVSPQDVRQSGLLKEYINLYVPAKNASGIDRYDPYLIKALEDFRSSRKAWEKYCSTHPSLKSDPVVPLLVIQLEAKSAGDSSSEEEKKRIEKIVGVVKSELPDIPEEAFAHVLSDTPDLLLAGAKIRHVSPESIQLDKSIQVLFAKEAISNGWDCPRAEVLFSRVRRKDPTYIAQFLGRMVRTPLGREIRGNQELNSVSAMLPDYDEKTVREVISYLTRDSVEENETTVTVNSVSIPLADPSRNPNSTFEPEIWKGIMDAVKKIQVPVSPKIPQSPFHLLQDTSSLIAESSYALRSSMGEMVGALNGNFHKYIETIASTNKFARKNFLDDFLKTGYFKETVDTKDREVSKELVGRLKDTSKDIYRKALSTEDVFTADFVKSYMKENSNIESEKDLIFVGRDNAALKEMKDWAKREQSKLWNEFTSSSLYEELNPSEQAKYDEIAGELEEVSGKTNFHNFKLNEFMTERLNDKAFEKCIYQGEDGTAHIHLNDLEAKCVEDYSRLDNTVAFFRNPPHGSGAFGILKEDGKHFYPDFIFFEVFHDAIYPYVVDPHGLQFNDSLSRIKGAVKYLQENPGLFSAWYAIDGDGNSINLADPFTQSKVEKATSASELYI